MTKILFFDKGGRKERISLIKKKKAPKDFIQGLDMLIAKGYDIEHNSSSRKYKKGLLISLGKLIEQFFSKLSYIGIRPVSVHLFKEKINNSDFIISLTDGFSMSLGFYYYFIDNKNKIKIAGAFHKLSDYDSNLPAILKIFYYKIIKKILERLDYIIFYGEADRLNSIKHFNLKKEKTYIIKFGVDIDFWIPHKYNYLNSNYLFSIGQDPARDFNTLLNVKTSKKIHIHTSLLEPIDNKNFKITNGSYHKYQKKFTDYKIKVLYQKSFAVIIPLKDVFQPSGYSVALQAMACGKPIILTLTKGLWAPKLFNNLKNCILVNPYNSQAIENAIFLLENNKDLYEKISRNARITAEKYFSLEEANKSILKLFKNFL